MLWINQPAAPSPEMPFGGVKDSGYGSEGGPEAMEPISTPSRVDHGRLRPVAAGQETRAYCPRRDGGLRTPAQTASKEKSPPSLDGGLFSVGAVILVGPE